MLRHYVKAFMRTFHFLLRVHRIFRMLERTLLL